MKYSMIALAAVCLACPAGAADVKVKDGSFEQPSVPDNAQQLFAPGSKMGSWQIAAGGNVALVNGDYSVDGVTLSAKRGAQMANLCTDGGTSMGSVYQFLKKASPDGSYKLSFDVGTVNDSSNGYGPSSTVGLWVGNHQVANYTVNGHGDKGRMVWQRFGIDITASPGTEIMFKGVNSNGNKFCGVDGVSIGPR